MMRRPCRDTQTPTPTRRGVLLCWLAGFVFVGCGVSPSASDIEPSPIVSAERYPDAFAAAAGVLRDAGFVVDRRDFRFGRITSRPKGSPTLLEPWKRDNADASLALRSTLGDLRRRAIVAFEPDVESAPASGSGPAAYRLRVEVVIERQQVPERRLSGATRGSVFADLQETPAELAQRGVVGRYWQPIERDTALEAELTRAILSRTVSDA
ncbi:MAG: hypothetical protein AAFX76_01140, partial [Planctomycetota bacterium]